VDPTAQFSPAGELVTAPPPVPETSILRVYAVAVPPNVAVTVVALSSVTTHAPVPLQPPPLQPLKVAPGAGVSDSVICVPERNVALHVIRQLIPVGELVTVPVPVPAKATVSTVGTETAKFAVTDVLVPRVTTHGPRPAQAPLHPVNAEPEAGVGVKVTCVPLANMKVHAVPQSIPAGELVTAPEPFPARATVSVTGFCIAVNVAVTAVLLSIVTTQLAAPLQAPDHPVNEYPLAGAAVRVTLEVAPNGAAQEVPQLIPDGLLTTVPDPTGVMVSW
jgi:hypothetical protein